MLIRQSQLETPIIQKTIEVLAFMKAAKCDHYKGLSLGCQQRIGCHVNQPAIKAAQKLCLVDKTDAREPAATRVEIEQLPFVVALR